MITRIFPFLSWFDKYDKRMLQADIIAGVTVALVLIPQSMAYAQLAGLPAYYGLYAAFLPPMIGALFGSSRQLATGPVAVVSLMTAASLMPLATVGSQAFVAYAILLAAMVGVIQLLLGVLKLGLVVNFLSHPVVNGFTNAAAIIIATSQLEKMFGVSVDGAEHHYETITRVVKAAMQFTHWPTFIMGVFAFGIMYGLKRLNPKIPNVLVAVVITTVISWAISFQHNYKATVADLPAPVTQMITDFNGTLNTIAQLGEKKAALTPRMIEAEKKYGHTSLEVLHLQHEASLITFQMEDAKAREGKQRAGLRSLLFYGIPGSDGKKMQFVIQDKTSPPAQHDGRTWRLQMGNKIIKDNEISLSGGGSVVGTVPQGLPSFGVPHIDMTAVIQFLPFAAIIALLGFMEAISIAKAMAAKTGQRLDPNQELIGQGLANILGSISKSYPASGSFSRSAVNLQAGACTGMSSVFTSITAIITLMLLTPLLYHLPQSVLAAVIMMAVIGLINVSGFVHAWHAQWYDGAISVITFIVTLIFAPHLDKGIMVGVILSLGVFLYKSMRPKVANLALHPDLSLRDAKHYGLRECRHIAVVRFDSPLFFANSSYLEDQITERMLNMPKLKHILIVANGINDMDASGEETLSLLVDRIRSAGYGISFSGVKENVLQAMERTHLYDKIGAENIYPLQAMALEAIHAEAHENSDERDCPLRIVSPRPEELKPVELKAEIKVPGAPSKILLVDDEREFVGLLADRLKVRSYGADVVYDGEQALSYVKKEEPDVMVLDLRMPGINGMDVLRQVKRNHPQVEVIILTGHGNKEDEKYCMELGAFAYLEKPIDLDVLTKTMQAAYDKVNRNRATQGQ
ncbi:MAG: response regulator [Deltaproteobacteria bacterium]|nr:response regulator [Deltaproteobacteria bacterium]